MELAVPSVHLMPSLTVDLPLFVQYHSTWPSGYELVLRCISWLERNHQSS